MAFSCHNYLAKKKAGRKPALFSFTAAGVVSHKHIFKVVGAIYSNIESLFRQTSIKFQIRAQPCLQKLYRIHRPTRTGCMPGVGVGRVNQGNVEAIIVMGKQFFRPAFPQKTGIFAHSNFGKWIILPKLFLIAQATAGKQGGVLFGV